MDFQDIEDIKEYFGITTDNLEEIRKELKLQLSKIHPDKTEGTFKSIKQRKEYEELSDAIKFLDSVNDQIVFSKKEFDVLEQKIDSLILARLHKPVAHESEYIERLDTSITSSILTFKKQQYFVKISSTILAGLLTLLWTFPTIVEKNKILKHLIDVDNLIFTSIWFGVIVLTCSVWIFTKNNERKDGLIKKRYGLVSTQNAIFKIFIAWINAVNIKSNEYDNKNHIHITYFTKEELMSFIFNFSEEYLKEFDYQLAFRNLSLEMK